MRRCFYCQMEMPIESRHELCASCLKANLKEDYGLYGTQFGPMRPLRYLYSELGEYIDESERTDHAALR